MSDDFTPSLLGVSPAVRCCETYIYSRNVMSLIKAATSTKKEVTKTAVHRLAARGWLQKGVSTVDSPC